MIPSQGATILVAEDDRAIRFTLACYLRAEGYRVLEAADGREALDRIRKETPDAVLLDLKMPERDGLSILAELGPALVELPVIVVTAYGGSAAAIEAMRRGAFDYLTKPFDLEKVHLVLRKALDQNSAPAFDGSPGQLDDDPDDDIGDPIMVGTSSAMREVYKAVGAAAAIDMPALIVGESGTGKELVATALHRHSARGSKPFVAVNCGSLPESLIESELFGHERGAFTGADRRRVGRFKRAQGGTIFLDEIAELPFSAQAKLLRVLQQSEFERVGGTEVVRANVRVISATHRDLEKEVAAGRFREDLYYRLNVVKIRIPPLRERREDIGPLAALHPQKTRAPARLASAQDDRRGARRDRVARLARQRPPARKRARARRDRGPRQGHPPRPPRPSRRNRRHPAP